ncbi:hypothetical protein [Streptomyces sp. NPDC001410]|uniref:hypothetical protein n=1 Tax=Streptomyces sp. NPDC001410 TaxID=3364574 RepID=UPI0036AABC34
MSTAQNLVTFTVTWSDRTEDGAGTFRTTNVRMPHLNHRFAARNIAKRVFGDVDQYDRVHILSIREAW